MNIRARFTPTTIGNLSANLSISVVGTTRPTLVPLSGTGVAAQVSCSPNPLTFLARSVGTTSVPGTVTLTNTGNTTLNMTSITLATANPAEFTNSGTCSTSTAIAPNATCTFAITFAPKVTGNRTAAITIVSNSLTPDILQISGVGQ